jgi:hypothetical protein
MDNPLSFSRPFMGHITYYTPNVSVVLSITVNM